MRWENTKKDRYYLATIERDIFGGCCIQKSWGGIGSNLGGGSCEPCGNPKAAKMRINEIKNERLRRGYVLIDSSI